MANINDDIANKLNELFKSELFKENNFIKIYKLLNIENTPAPPPPAADAASPSLTLAAPPPAATPAATPAPSGPSGPAEAKAAAKAAPAGTAGTAGTAGPGTGASAAPASATSAATSLPPKGIQNSDKIYNTSILDNQNSNIVIVVFVIVVFNIDGIKIFEINDIYKDLNVNIINFFNDLKKEDLYKADKADKYVKYHISNDKKKYIFCIEPDFRDNNDDTTILVDELFDILTNIYNSIIKKFNSLSNQQKLKLRLSVPSIMSDNVSIINKKTILGCFSKIYKANYIKYDLYIENKDLFNYFITLI